jgi:hypothetical protein
MRLRDIVGVVMQVLMRRDIPTPETFLCDHIAAPFWNSGEVRMPVSGAISAH